MIFYKYRNPVAYPMGEAAGTTIRQPPLIVCTVPAAHRLPVTHEDSDIMARQFHRLSRWMVAARRKPPVDPMLYMDHQVAVTRRFIGDYVERPRHYSREHILWQARAGESAISSGASRH